MAAIMSVDTCTKCGKRVDTDFDEEFYGPQGDEDGMCATCRAIEVEYLLRDQWLDDPRRS